MSKVYKKIVVSALVGAISLGGISYSVQAQTQQIEVHFINVGQGDATYIELPDGTDILVDAGKSNMGSTVVNYLNNQENGMVLDYLVATHPDADHVGGMKEVFKSMSVKNFYYPVDAPHDTKTWQDVLGLARQEGCKIVDAKSNTTLNLGGAVVKFIQPNKDYSDNNEDSLVTYIDYNNFELLLTGDIEAITEKDMVSQGLTPNIDFMSIPHHGSKSSSTVEFITKVDPEYAVVSVGENSYGHPVPEILQRYSSIGAKVYRTDKDGNVVIKSDGNSDAIINTTKVSITEVPLNDWKNHWAANEISYAMNNGWINKTDNFRPNDAITRAEFVKIVNKAFGFTGAVQTESFDDVKQGDWFYDEVRIALKAGYITSKNSTFRPNDPITREEVASIVTSIKNNKDGKLDKLSKYKDANGVSEWAKTSVEGAIEQGYMGKNSEYFRPKDNITRAEAVVTLSRIPN